jgi:hypothetical protein
MPKKKKTKEKFLREETETLFQFVPPQRLRKTLHEVYSVYLQNIHTLEFREIAMDMYFLNKYLERVEGHPPGPLPKRTKPTHKGESTH